MADIFRLRWEERAGREFQLFNNQHLKLSREVRTLEESYVTINSATGMITLSKRIDRDVMCGHDDECILKIQVGCCFIDNHSALDSKAQ